MFLLFFILYTVFPILMDYLFILFGREEFFRKIIHIYGGVLFYFMIQYLSIVEITILGVFALICFFLSRKYKLIKLLEAFSGRGYGEIYFLFGLYYASFISLYDIKIAEASILILAFADGLAPFGKLIYSKKLFGDKTIGGSTVFLIITFILLVMFFGFNIYFIPIALIITATELFLSQGLDNLFIPIFVSILLYLLFHFSTMSWFFGYF